VRELEHDHRLTRWYTGRVDRNLAEIAATQAEHTDALNRVESILTEHNGRFDSVESTLTVHNGRFDSLDAQMRSLTQMVAQLLRTLPPSPDEHTDD
jgi:hypothetical protein